MAKTKGRGRPIVKPTAFARPAKKAATTTAKGRVEKRHAAAPIGSTGKPNPKRLNSPGAAPSGPRQWQCSSQVDRQAAWAMQALLEADAGRGKGVTLKSLTLAPHIQAKKATYAVTCQAMKYLPVLKDLAQRAEVPTSKISTYTALVLIYELVFGEGLHQRGPAERIVLKRKAALHTALAALKAERGVKTKAGLLPASSQFQGVAHPRWLRVNTLKISPAQALEQLQVQYPGAGVDPLLPELLALPPGSDLHDHPLVVSGCCVLQGKASCLPAAALDPQPGWTVVDCCAAPGNKTTHLAARMQGEGRIFAFDKDARRLARLTCAAQLTGSAGVISSLVQDFLLLDTQDPQYSQVRGVLLDPSCSGSGTVFSRMDHLLPSWQQQQQQQQPGHRRSQAAKQEGGEEEGSKVEETGEQEEEEEEEGEVEEENVGVGGGHEKMGGGGGGEGGAAGSSPRVLQLAAFQAAALRHALTFPALQRLVYSTCSVHAEENEEVVRQVLGEAAQRGFHLEDPFPSWPRRGLPLFPGCDKLVRTDAHQDGTDGFFVALFQRRPQDVGGSGAAAVTGGGQPDRPLDVRRRARQGTADFTTSSQAAEEAKERGSTKRRGAGASRQGQPPPPVAPSLHKRSKSGKQ